MKLILNLLIFFFIFSNIGAQSSQFYSYIDEFLQNDNEFQKKENKLLLLKAAKSIEQSINWLDINFDYQSNENTIKREQYDYKISGAKSEISNIDEIDEQLSVEISKKFFKKDFDNVTDIFFLKLDIIKNKHEYNIFKIKRLDDIINNFINFKQADLNLEILSEKLLILQRENKILENLYSENISSAEDLKQNIVRILDIENQINDWIKIKNENSFFSDIIFYQYFDEFINTANIIFDSTQINQKIDTQKKLLHKDSRKLSNVLKLNYLYFYFPETTLSFSYNKRTTNQDWKISEDADNYLRDRDIVEEYPEFGLEISLPLNFYSNTIGKSNLLKSYKREIKIQNYELIIEYDLFKAKFLSDFQNAQKIYELQKRIYKLSEKQFENAKKKYNYEPSILGENPEIELNKEELKLKNSFVEYKISMMNYYKTLFIFKYFIGN